MADFLRALFTEWVTLMGIASIGIAIWSRVKGRDLTNAVFTVIGATCLFVAFYDVWSSEHERVIELSQVGRHVTAEQRDALTAFRPPAAECPLLVTWMPGSDEGRRYAKEIAAALRIAGWRVETEAPLRLGELPGLHVRARQGEPMAIELARILSGAQVAVETDPAKSPCQLEIIVGGP